MTCHKAQGGEWDTTIVDFSTSTKKLNGSYFRWCYTALTRSKNKMFCVDEPKIGIADRIKKINGNIYHGGRKSTGIDALKFAEKMESMGAGEILLTSMDRDGTKKGYDLDLTKKISNLVNIPVIASGGVGGLEHLHQGIKIGKASAVLAASIFHFGEHTILEAKQYLDSKGIPVRI